jgi:hypothetical protein
MTQEDTSPIRIDCTECRRPTNHDLLHSKGNRWDDEDSGICGGEVYRTLECRGCGTISLAVDCWNSEDTDRDGDPISTQILYPSRTVRKPMESHYFLPNKVRVVYEETLKALSNKAPILAAIGIRAVVEAVCKDKGCAERNLEKNIELLVKKGHLASDQADFLHLQRFMGNVAAHEIEPPEQNELTAALDIAENLLANLYVLPELAEKMQKSKAQLAARKVRTAKLTSTTKKVTSN